jgi:hypothetical protein
MKNAALLLSTIILLAPLFAQAAKPLSPLQLSIIAEQSGLGSEAIKPGDVVNLKITAKTYIDTDDLLLNIELHGGVQLISGGLSWLGSANKGDEKVLLISVRAPKQGKGRIKARASISRSMASLITAETEYSLGKVTQQKSSVMPPNKLNSNGRMIREYRPN